mmetsp:Transcript_2468/g.3351  ORF Transcript_2468/g.3351 Transcript_2468/m.3351 type:complete len:369 (+) Transcript_2468:33-1139(+)
MSLAFLFKKGWHTSTIKNQEKVWLAEQKHEAEQQRIRDLQKQVEEERQVRELQELQGVRLKGDDRIDWMYEGTMKSREDEAKEAESYLLGKKMDSSSKYESDKQNSSKSLVDGKMLPSANPNEIFRKLHEDPLLKMKQAEKSARDKIIFNPLKMNKIHSEVERKEKAKKAMKKEKKRERRKAKKKSKKQRKKREKLSSSSSSSSKEPQPKRNKTTERTSTVNESEAEKQYGLIGQNGRKTDYTNKDLGPDEKLMESKMLAEKEERLRAEEARKRKSHRLTKDEKLRIAREMEMDAGAYESNKKSAHEKERLARAREREMEQQNINRGSAKFLKEVDKAAMENFSLSERVARSRHYRQKEADSDNFMKR